jgi:hypothetical protein
MLGTGFYIFKALLRVKIVAATSLCPSVADASSTATPFNKVYLKKDKNVSKGRYQNIFFLLHSSCEALEELLAAAKERFFARPGPGSTLA